MNRVILILGGARSGKSRFALELGRRLGGTHTYIATAESRDDEMAKRIADHRRQRPADWKTIEEPLGLVEALQAVQEKTDVVIVDCLTLWLSNLLIEMKGDEGSIRDEIERVVTAATRLDGTIIAVSNEVGLGIIPADPISRLFRDLAGMMHQRWTQDSHEVYWMIAGIPLTIKGARDGHTGTSA